jgi:TolA-binding protein
MDMNGFKHTTDMVVTPGRATSKLNGALRTESSAQQKQTDLQEEIRQLRSEMELLRDQQRALQRTPQSNDTGLDTDTEDQ